MDTIKLYDAPIKIELRTEQNILLVDGVERKPDVRYLSKMAEVLASPNTKLLPSTPLYYMYRNIHSAFNTRYDITVIPANLIGEEYSKTYGHYHPNADDSIVYPELYQVLGGSAMFIMQSKNSDASVNVITTAAEKGDVVLFPPNYGHVSINKGSDTLILANLVADNFQSLYEDYELYHGAAYYYTTNGLVQNSNYVIRSADSLSPAEINKKYDFECSDLLTEFFENPRKFEFLKRPILKFKKF